MDTRTIFPLDTPYNIQLQVSFGERDIALWIFYFDNSEGSQLNLICLEKFDRCSYVLQNV